MTLVARRVFRDNDLIPNEVSAILFEQVITFIVVNESVSAMYFRNFIKNSSLLVFSIQCSRKLKVEAIV